MTWRLGALLLAPFLYGLIASLPSRGTPDIRFEEVTQKFGFCSGTRVSLELKKRPPGPVVTTTELPVRGWKSIRAGPLVLETNLSKRDAESLARTAVEVLRFIERETGLVAPDAVTVRVFNSARHYETYAASIKAPRGPSFLDRTRGEAVLSKMYVRETLSQTAHQLVHIMLADGAAPPWLEEGLAESVSALRIDGAIGWNESIWRPPGMGEWFSKIPEVLQADQEAFVRLGDPRAVRVLCRLMVDFVRRKGGLKAHLAGMPFTEVKELVQGISRYGEGPGPGGSSRKN